MLRVRGPSRNSRRALAKHAFLLCALAPAFGCIGVAAAVADAVWFRLPSGVADQEYVSLGRRADLSKRVEGVAATSVAEIRERAPEVRWLAVERLQEVDVVLDSEGASATRRLRAEGVSGGFFDALGVEAARGGLSVAADVPAVVLGHAVWQRVFSRADVVGKTLTISGEGAILIAGVAPPGFQGLLGEQAELWVLNPERLPSRLAQDDFLKGVEAAIPNKHVFGVVGEDMSLAKLRAVLAGMNFVDDPASGRALGVTPADRLEITPGLEVHPDMRREVLARTYWLVAIVACMFVLAFAALVDALATEQAAGAEDQRLRAALGASPWLLYRQGLAARAGHALVMAGAATAAGAYIGDVLLSVQPFAAWLVELPLDSIAVGFALGAGALLAAHALAAALAVRFVAVAFRPTSTAAPWRKSPATRRLLLLSATASLLLVASAAERYWREADSALGFASERALLVQVWSEQGAPSETVLRGVIEALPQVRQAARMDLLPLVPPLSRANSAQVLGDARFERGTVLFSGVEADYLETLGAALLAGRLHDGAAEVTVSRTFANRLLDGGDLAQALGQAIRLRRDAHDESESELVATVVGVVEDIAYGHYLDGQRAAVYGHARLAPWDQRWAIDHDGDAAAVVAALRRAKALEGFEVVSIGTPAELFRTQFMARRSVEILLAGAAALTLLLALGGIAASQARRLAEDQRAIGIGIALGASGWALALRYLDGLLVDFAVAALLPCAALVAVSIVLPVATAGLTAMLATSLVVPVLAIVAAVSSAIVVLAVQRRVRTTSPAALMRAD